MKLDKIKTICSEFGNDTSCSLSFNRIKPIESDDNTSESSETTDEVNTIVEELPYVYTINTDLKNINIGFSKNINDADILDDDFEPGILTLAQLSHIIEPYSNDFNVIINASNETEGGLNVDDLTNFSFNKEFLNHYLFSFSKNNSVFIVGEVNKDRYFDEPNALLILAKVYYANTFTNYSYEYGSENIDIISPDDYNYDTHKNYNNAILMCSIIFDSDKDLELNGELTFENISFDDIRIIRNRDNIDIFNELISLLFNANLDENSDAIIDYTFKHYNIKSVVDYLESIKYVMYEETLNTGEDTEIKVNKATALYTETVETIQSDISNYRKQAEIDLTKLYNRIEFSDITTNILDGVVHKNFYTDIENDKSYYIDTQDSFKEHINKVVTSILGTLEKINENKFIPAFIEQRDTVLTSILTNPYDVGTIADFCAENASLEYNHDTSVYYLIDTINYTVNYENGVRSSKMYFNMLNTNNLTDKLKLGNNIIYEYKNNTSGDSKYGQELNFSSKNIGNKLTEFNHYFYDDMDFGTIMLKTKSDLRLVNDTQSLKNNVLFIDNNDDLDEIYIPNCITTLGDDLFSNCANLSLLELPKYLTNIGKNVFPNYDITIGYAKNPIDSRSWLNKEFTGTYNYYAPNYNGYNTLLFYPPFENNQVNITTTGFDDIDIVSIGKQSITLTNSDELNIILDSTTEYIDDDAIKFVATPVTKLTITATNSPLWYFDISKYNTNFENINMLLNTLSPVCLYYDKEKTNPIYTYNNETFRDIQRNALTRIFETDEPENLDDLIELQDSSPKLSVTNIDDIHLIAGCKILNNEIRFIKRTNLTNDTFSLVITRQSVANCRYTADYEFSENVRIIETLGTNTYYAKYTLIDESFCETILSKAPRRVLITDVFGESANTLKTIYIKLDDDGFFVEPSSFDYNANYSGNGGITLTPVINGNFKVKTNNIGSADEYELLHTFLDNTDLDIKQFILSNDGVNYKEFNETLNSLNANCLNIESNFINTGGLQYITKADSKILDNINIFPLFFTTNSIYNGSIKMFLKTTDQLYSIQLSDIKTLSEIGISKLLLNDKFNPRLIEFPESINRFYDCPIIIDETYDTEELTLRFWSNFEDVITRKTLLDIEAIQKQIINVSGSAGVGVQVIDPGISVSSPSNNVLYPTFGNSSVVNNSFGFTQNNSFGFKQNNNVLCICTNSNSLEKLIRINSEKLKTLRIQVKDGEEYEHIYNFFKTNINKLIQMNTPNNHTLNIVVEKFVHINNVDSEVATYNFYDF